MTNLSVIIVTHNRARHLLRLVREVLHQLKRGDEVIIIDDGSSDLWVKFYNCSLADSPLVRYLYTPHKGYRLGKLRNIGNLLAKNDAVVHLDDDFSIANNALSIFRENYDPNKIIAGRVDYRGLAPGNRVYSGPGRHLDPRIASGSGLEKHPDPNIHFRVAWGSFICYSKTKALKVGGYREEFDGVYGAEDVDFSVRMAYAGIGSYFVPEAVCVHDKRLEGSWRTPAGTGKSAEIFWDCVSQYKEGIFPEPVQSEVLMANNHVVDREVIFGKVRDGYVERIDPEYFGKPLSKKHIGRYEWASSYAKNQTVLDVGCGTGYGCDILTNRGAKRVVGMDVSLQALAFGVRKNYKYLSVCADGVHLPFRPSSWDVIIAFELLEHLRARGQVRFLSEVHRSLVPGGTFILSSPNSRKTDGRNPYHLRERTLAELCYFLKRTGLRIVSTFGQDEVDIVERAHDEDTEYLINIIVAGKES